MGGKRAGWWAMALAAASTAGCAVHSQAPVKEVAYDFSDADFYDRAYAPSPKYDARYHEQQVEVIELSDAALMGAATGEVIDLTEAGAERRELRVRTPR